MPMKKNSTPVVGMTDTLNGDRRVARPQQATLAFLRQFARVYRPTGNAALPGIVLN